MARIISISILNFQIFGADSEVRNPKSERFLDNLTSGTVHVLINRHALAEVEIIY